MAERPLTAGPIGEPAPEQANAVLVVNTGSSSLKLRVLDPSDRVVAGSDIEPWDPTDMTPLAAFVAGAPPLSAVGHRVVHGGNEFRSATLIDDAVLHRIDALSGLAPLHQRRAMAAIRAARAALPGVPAVACFDTAYHADLPPAAATYALPEAWRERWALRRFGFHGLSHAYAAGRATELLAGSIGAMRVVTCHLGAGASLCASVAGRSVDTTMGFTPLDGLVMQTRSGSVDPGLVLWLIAEGGLDPGAVLDGLEHHGGLAGLAGGSGDMRDVLTRRAADDNRAGLAFDVYVRRLAAGIAAMTTAMHGIDAVVFTGGVGEHAPDVRQAAADRLGHLGVAIDQAANSAPAGIDRDVSASGAGASTLVVAAREDLEIARQTRAALRMGPTAP